jgi:flagellar biosynthetic protein FliP
MSFATAVQALAALGLVLALAWAAARALRGSRFVSPQGRRLHLAESLALDPRRRLLLIRCDNREALLLTGGTTDVMLGWVEPPPAVPPAEPPTTGPLLKAGLMVLALLLLAGPAAAQSVAIDLGTAGQAGSTSRLVQLTALIGLLSLAPSLLVMVTGFARIAIVLSLLRSAIGAQGVPPNPVLIGLALFLTFFVMQPTFEASWQNGLAPMMEGRIAELEGLRLSAEPFRQFMVANVRDADLALFQDLSQLPQAASVEQTSWRVLVPAFLVGELKRAFEIGFLLFLPFLVIDMVVASLLMSLGMMMLPPSVVSLPFKLIFFVLVDGWRLVAGSLVQGFAS